MEYYMTENYNIVAIEPISLSEDTINKAMTKGKFFNYSCQCIYADNYHWESVNNVYERDEVIKISSPYKDPIRAYNSILGDQSGICVKHLGNQFDRAVEEVARVDTVHDLRFDNRYEGFAVSRDGIELMCLTGLKEVSRENDCSDNPLSVETLASKILNEAKEKKRIALSEAQYEKIFDAIVDELDDDPGRSKKGPEKDDR